MNMFKKDFRCDARMVAVAYGFALPPRHHCPLIRLLFAVPKYTGRCVFIFNFFFPFFRSEDRHSRSFTYLFRIRFGGGTRLQRFMYTSTHTRVYTRTHT